MVEDLIRIYVISLDTPPAARLVPAPCTCNPVASIVGLHLPDTISLLGSPFFCPTLKCAN